VPHRSPAGSLLTNEQIARSCLLASSGLPRASGWSCSCAPGAPHISTLWPSGSLVVRPLGHL